jgi:hypothetical protein
MKLKQILEARYARPEADFYVTTGVICRGYADNFEKVAGPVTAEEAAELVHDHSDHYGAPDHERESIESIVSQLKSYNGMWQTPDGRPVWDYGYDEGVIGVMPGRFPTADDYGTIQ